MTRPYILQPIIPKEAEELIKAFYQELNKTSLPLNIESYISKILISNNFKALSEEDQLSTKLFLQVILDTIRQGWEIKHNGEFLEATPPDQLSNKQKDLPEIKKRIRRGLEEARNEQIREPSVKKFILNLERPRWFKGKQVSVLNHFLKPMDLYNDLMRRLNAPVEIRDELLNDSIDPYIQLVNNEKDKFTNIKLKDIWRYARYSWSLPLSSQPGRQMLYLVRDASREFHPIIGIGALGSSIAQITCRDNVIGWTIESLEENENLQERLIALENGIELGIQEVYHVDLLDKAEIKDPNLITIKKLKSIIEELSNKSSGGKLNTNSFFDDALKPEYKLKRATDLEELLHAKIFFKEADLNSNNYIEKYKYLMNSKEGKRALKIAIRNVKKIHMGSSIMDITTCGAVPPYNTVLGGKLVSLLMTSPIVIRDYYEKYKEAISEIASRKKGEMVIKPAKLAMLATTSLYYTGSSQYNRIKYSATNGEIRYSLVGKTRGFGSVHLSAKTYRTLQELLKSHSNLKPESSTFSAGVNYKMRSISTGLGHLGLRKLQQHENPRLVYLAPLLTNWKEYLTGIDSEPEYIYDIENPEKETDAIIRYWKKRWYIGRIKKSEVIRRLKSNNSLKISNNLETETIEEHQTKSNDLAFQQLDLFGGESMTNQQLLSWETLAELKDQRASFAERLTKEEIESLHIQTKLDVAISGLLHEKKRVYLVGSPGDGKTHIIKKYLPTFPEGTFYHLDASAIEEDSMVENLEHVIENKLPSIVAINEGPLRKLLKRLPIEESKMLRLQLDRPFLYGIEDNNVYEALIINLGHRQVLSNSLLEEALNTVLKKVNYNNAPTIVRYNVSMLSRARVKQRLIKLLSYLTKSGHHITMHRLLGFLSYIITNGVTKSEYSSKIKPYYNAIFDRENPLFQMLKIFDPVRITHPLVDMLLCDGKADVEIEWIENDTGENGNQDLTYSDLKRKFYFEAENGEELLNMIPEDYQNFYELLEGTGEKRRAKRKIMEALSSFFGQRNEDNKLQVWTGIKYESKRDPSVFISSQTVSDDQIEIYTPKMREQVKNLIEYEPTHIRMAVKPNKDSDTIVGLDINLELWLSLMKIKRGISNLYQDPVIVRRLTTFMSHLSSQLNGEMNSEININVQDTESGVSYEIAVSYENGKRGKYYW
ncbi:Druantia anti-phage system protein DruA [Bacillus velezensis]|uniref:Druantia anti-phage system protein DruA n=1 Tax=Bacillus velezensis TaxID=492670 RepID=UPI000696CED1|nr:Druantia anti-phage system protein DruA [Bacillus velezensis]